MNFLIPHLKDLIDITLVGFVIYRIISSIRNRETYQILAGFIIVVGMYSLAIVFQLRMTTSILKGFKDYWMLAFVILFQPELRSFLSKAWTGNFKYFTRNKYKKNDYSQLLNAISTMSFRKTGVLIIFEKNNSLDKFIETGEIIDSVISTKLLLTIFNKNTILHDGAVIIRDKRIYAVKVVLPLSKIVKYTKSLGTRHLAAIGITEETDAFSIVVSEETGEISFQIDGQIYPDLSLEELYQRIVDAEKE